MAHSFFYFPRLQIRTVLDTLVVHGWRTWTHWWHCFYCLPTTTKQSTRWARSAMATMAIDPLPQERKTRSDIYRNGLFLFFSGRNRKRIILP